MLEDKYDAKKVEDGKYDTWLKNGYFESGDKSKEAYCIVIPPPNVTGKLHIGHAMDNTNQDLICRYMRLRGKDVLWVPGMDHAGIATQAKVDERLKKEGISRYDLGREEFLKRAWQWKDEYASFIHDQWKKLGISVDYRKERFTLDEGPSKAVAKVFVTYYKEGLIYQDYRIINWDPEAKTALSNIEVIHKDVKGAMYYFKYQVLDSDESFIVATTRPETMFGDVCVVVHPDDERYKHLIGKYCINPANGDKLLIIADEYIDIEFGTGAMKCTPAHDPNDYEIAKRHNLEMRICMKEDATMNELAGEFAGMDRFKCREALTKKIESEGNLVKIEEITHSVGHSERTGVMVEPYLSKQWFVKMKPLAMDVIKAQEKEATKINFYPKRFEKTFLQWLENIEDWCISRQLWWGHRIPVWYHKKTGAIYCEEEAPKDIENYVQDEDVLDTWFSSALWPFSTLGWPEESEDLKRYFPTSCMVTGYDIIFFWVARMAFSARHFMHDVPFKDCLIHGLIRDEKGRKMSKSLGNGIDPIEVIDEYGCDALRLFLLTNSTPGLDSNFSKTKIEAAWNFLNKFYNASRFVLMHKKEEFKSDITPYSKVDHYILARLNYIIKQTQKNLDRYEFAIAGNELIDFIWDDFCSNYIEFAKPILNGTDEKAKEATRHTLLYVLEVITRLLNPFVPFIAEEIYGEIHSKEDSINTALWPEVFEGVDETKAKEGEGMIEIIKKVRELKSTNDLKPSSLLHARLKDTFDFDETCLNILKRLIKLEFVSELSGETMIIALSKGSLELLMDEVSDKEATIQKLRADLKHYESEIKRSKGILSNENFLKKAPKDKVDSEKEKLEKYESSYQAILEKLKELG